MKRQFQAFNFSIRNEANDTVDINIDGAIVDAETQEMYEKWFGDTTSTSFKSFRDQLNAVNANTINVYINSGGGLVTDAMAIHDLLVDLQAKGKTVNTIGRGIIASASTYILMAGGKNAEMSANSWFMIHNVSGWAWGDVNEVERMAATLRKFNDTTRDFYANATGKRKEDIAKMMNAETWMTAEEAKANGFISKVSSETKFSNSIQPEHWQFTNMAVLNSYNAAVKPTEQAPAQQTFTSNQFEDMKKIFTDFTASIANAFKNIKAPENNDHSALMNSISDALTKQFETLGEQMEGAVNEAVKTAVENSTKELNDKIVKLETTNVDLKKINDELVNDITKLKGNPTNQQEQNQQQTVGKWS